MESNTPTHMYIDKQNMVYKNDAHKQYYYAYTEKMKKKLGARIEQQNIALSQTWEIVGLEHLGI